MRVKKLINGAALVLALATGQALAETPKNTLVVADAIDDIITLDPGEVSEVGGVLAANQIYQPLLTAATDDSSKIIGVLAESWTASPDGKTHTFKMRPGLKFASGNPVTARDAEYSLRRVVQMKSRSAFILTQFGFTPENVKDRIKATDDMTLVIEIGDTYAPSFLYYCLSSYVGGIVDSKLVQEHEVNGDFGNGWLKVENSAGSGPYVLTRWEPKQSIMLTRNPNYTGETGGLERIFLQHVPESAAQRLLLEKGDIDIANKLGPDDFGAIEENPDVGFVDGRSGTIYYMGLNVRNEHLAKPKVVQALKYLVDYQGIADTISRGTVEVHQTLVPKGFLGEIDYNPYKLDIEKAKALLGEAGISGELTLDTVVWNTPPYTDFAQAIQATMAQAGIKLNLEVVDGQQWLERYRSSNLDIWLGLWGPDYPDPHSNAKAFAVNKQDAPDGSAGLADRFGWNAGSLSQEAMAAVREQDTDKRRVMYETLQKAHTDTSPFLYMFQQVRKVGVRSSIKGVVLGQTFADDRYWNVTK
ncbi:ABC transporter substrate-binding protein [Ensifer sp. ENS06]|uniref:ABC transporter substrate-binding protein n=1 Tax=Ensifer sp. ENS06 TaxID=2769276 RepID=UPI000DE02872|nr:ABC transporter substrate-binding protein [Ensifer sp. ENS06]MBD9624924.1 ABC transporter substrate-binding protein [Ensifer sp. ENS06]